MCQIKENYHRKFVKNQVFKSKAAVLNFSFSKEQGSLNFDIILSLNKRKWNIILLYYAKKPRVFSTFLVKNTIDLWYHKEILEKELWFQTFKAFNCINKLKV